jgi:2-dehydro-3-deoxyphosphooctonate aldolase (KDO 8-P synthase)
MNLFETLLHGEKFFLIAGPCVVEDMSIMRRTAERLLQETVRRGITLVFKASYRKHPARRSPLCRPGKEAGLAALDTIKREFGGAHPTDIHEGHEAAIAGAGGRYIADAPYLRQRR